MDKNEKNLPVLYTIPKWKMYITYGKKGLLYFNPYSNEYVNKLSFKSELSKVGISEQDWYDRWILNITTKSSRPRCLHPGCNKEATFLGASPSRGYRLSCTKSTHVKFVQKFQMSLSASLLYSLNPEFAKKRGRTLSDRYKNSEEMRNAARDRSINRYKNQEERDRTSSLTKAALNAPGMHEKISASQKKSYENNPDRRLNASIKGKERYQDINERIRQSEIAKEISSRPGVNDMRSKSVKRTFESNNTRELLSKLSLKMWSNPSESRINAKGCYGTKSKAFSEWEGKEVHFDSTWEDAFFNKCVEMKVESLLREPIRIPYFRDGNTTGIPNSYYPDFLLNNHYLIEIKPNYLLDANEDKFLAADLYCRENGLEYVILTEDYLFNNGEPFYGSMPF